MLWEDLVNIIFKIKLRREISEEARDLNHGENQLGYHQRRMKETGMMRKIEGKSGKSFVVNVKWGEVFMEHSILSTVTERSRSLWK